MVKNGYGKKNWQCKKYLFDIYPVHLTAKRVVLYVHDNMRL